MADKYRTKRFSPEVDPDAYAAYAAAEKRDREASRLCGPGYEEIDAPTKSKGDKNPRPRAQKCCFNRNTSEDREQGTLVIVMTDPGPGGRPKYTWIQYDNVPHYLWDDGLKTALSTNEFIQEALLGYHYTVSSFGDLPRTRDDSFNIGTTE